MYVSSAVVDFVLDIFYLVQTGPAYQSACLWPYYRHQSLLSKVCNEPYGAKLVVVNNVYTVLYLIRDCKYCIFIAKKPKKDTNVYIVFPEGWSFKGDFSWQLYTQLVCETITTLCSSSFLRATNFHLGCDHNCLLGKLDCRVLPMTKWGKC